MSFSAKKTGCIKYHLYYNEWDRNDFLDLQTKKNMLRLGVLKMKAVEEYLNNIPMWAVRKNTLQDVRRYLEELGNPDDSMKIIHVAGTNGKGSVCSYLTSSLLEAGYQVATFTSPHLVQVRERFLMNGHLVEEEVFGRAFSVVKQLSDKMVDRGYQPPTYFEFLFYMFLVIVGEQKPDFVVLETGLGGRLDVTNVIRRPVLTVITSISMDHMQYLGTTVEAIAGEKAGIIKPGVPVVFDGSGEESSLVIRSRAEQLGSPWLVVTEDAYQLVSRDSRGTKLCVKMDGQKEALNKSISGTTETNEDEILLTIASQADYQMMNVSLAVWSLQVLRNAGICRISQEALTAGMSRSFWPGRMELVAENVYLDGAHNAGGVEALNRTIRRMQKETGKPVTLMFGAVSDKDHHRMIQTICSGVKLSQVIIAHMDSKRCADTKQLADEFAQALRAGEAGKNVSVPVRVFPCVKEAWEYFMETKDEDLAFCAGSLYLVGEVKSLLAGGTR